MKLKPAILALAAASLGKRSKSSLVWNNVGVSTFALFSASLFVFGMSFSELHAADILSAGDVAIIARDVDNDDFAFTLLNHIEAGQILYFTDNGWTGTGFRGVTNEDGTGNEGMVKWTADAFLAAGTIVTAYGDVSGKYTWTDTGVIPGATTSYTQAALGSTGEQIYTFATSATDDPSFTTGSITHLYVLDDTNGFENATSSSNGNITPGLTLGSTAITLNADGAQDDDFLAINNSTLSGATKTKSQWLSAFGNSANYSEASSGTLPTGTISVSTTNTSALTFGGTAGTVNLTGPSSSGGLNFTTTGYSLAGSAANTVTITSGNVNVSTGSATVSAPIVGASAVTKTGAGMLTLSGNNTFSGATSVNQGKLVVTNTIGNSAVTVSGSGAILATDTAATIGSTLRINNGAILAVGDAANATTATATVTGATAFDNGSIFSWDINAAGTSYDKLVSSSIAGEVLPGDAVFRIVVADTTFASTFWDTNRTWTDIFTTNGSTAIANWALVFGNTVSVVNSSFNSITPVDGSFSITGSTLTWTAVPEPTSALAGLLITAGLLRRRRVA